MASAGMDVEEDVIDLNAVVSRDPDVIAQEDDDAARMDADAPEDEFADDADQEEEDAAAEEDEDGGMDAPSVPLSKEASLWLNESLPAARTTAWFASVPDAFRAKEPRWPQGAMDAIGSMFRALLVANGNIPPDITKLPLWQGMKDAFHKQSLEAAYFGALYAVKNTLSAIAKQDDEDDSKWGDIKTPATRARLEALVGAINRDRLVSHHRALWFIHDVLLRAAAEGVTRAGTQEVVLVAPLLNWNDRSSYDEPTLSAVEYASLYYNFKLGARASPLTLFRFVRILWCNRVAEYVPNTKKALVVPEKFGTVGDTFNADTQQRTRTLRTTVEFGGVEYHFKSLTDLKEAHWVRTRDEETEFPETLEVPAYATVVSAFEATADNRIKRAAETFVKKATTKAAKASERERVKKLDVVVPELYADDVHCTDDEAFHRFVKRKSHVYTGRFWCDSDDHPDPFPVDKKISDDDRMKFEATLLGTDGDCDAETGRPMGMWHCVDCATDFHIECADMEPRPRAQRAKEVAMVADKSIMDMEQRCLRAAQCLRSWCLKLQETLANSARTFARLLVHKFELALRDPPMRLSDRDEGLFGTVCALRHYLHFHQVYAEDWLAFAVMECSQLGVAMHSGQGETMRIRNHFYFLAAAWPHVEPMPDALQRAEWVGLCRRTLEKALRATKPEVVDKACALLLDQATDLMDTRMDWPPAPPLNISVHDGRAIDDRFSRSGGGRGSAAVSVNTDNAGDDAEEAEEEDDAGVRYVENRAMARAAQVDLPRIAADCNYRDMGGVFEVLGRLAGQSQAQTAATKRTARKTLKAVHRVAMPTLADLERRAAADDGAAIMELRAQRWRQHMKRVFVAELTNNEAQQKWDAEKTRLITYHGTLATREWMNKNPRPEPTGAEIAEFLADATVDWIREHAWQGEEQDKNGEDTRDEGWYLPSLDDFVHLLSEQRSVFNLEDEDYAWQIARAAMSEVHSLILQDETLVVNPADVEADEDDGDDLIIVTDEADMNRRGVIAAAMTAAEIAASEREPVKKTKKAKGKPASLLDNEEDDEETKAEAQLTRTGLLEEAQREREMRERAAELWMSAVPERLTVAIKSAALVRSDDGKTIHGFAKLTKEQQAVRLLRAARKRVATIIARFTVREFRDMLNEKRIGRGRTFVPKEAEITIVRDALIRAKVPEESLPPEDEVVETVGSQLDWDAVAKLEEQELKEAEEDVDRTAKVVARRTVRKRRKAQYSSAKETARRKAAAEAKKEQKDEEEEEDNGEAEEDNDVVDWDDALDNAEAIEERVVEQDISRLRSDAYIAAARRGAHVRDVLYQRSEEQRKKHEDATKKKRQRKK